MKLRKALVATSLTFIVLILGSGIYWHRNHGPSAFNRAVWLQGESLTFSSDNPRLRMADTLVDEGILLGKSKAEIAAMLGPPTSTDKFENAGLVFWLGAERGFMSIDSEWLTLDFDTAGKVNGAQIVRD